MFVVPCLDMLVVLNSTNFDDTGDARLPIDLVYEVIVPAMTKPD